MKKAKNREMKELVLLRRPMSEFIDLLSDKDHESDKALFLSVYDRDGVFTVTINSNNLRYSQALSVLERARFHINMVMSGYDD